MYATDFEYDGRYLSDYGFIVCDFDSSDGANAVDSGSKLTFNTISQYKGNKHSLVDTQYEDCIQATFDVCKNPDIYDDLEITIEEYRELVRWLNRKQFLKFRIFDDENELDPCYYEASFNISKIKINEILYGIRLEMTTNRPFGFGQEQRKVFNFQDETQFHVLNDISDEIGYIYPLMTITCYANGNLRISNDITKCRTVIRNCSENEIITIDEKTGTITSSDVEHDVYNDFNYEFFKIGNTIDNRSNKITVNAPCKIELRYAPIIKNSV